MDAYSTRQYVCKVSTYPVHLGPRCQSFETELMIGLPQTRRQGKGKDGKYDVQWMKRDKRDGSPGTKGRVTEGNMRRD